MAFWFMALVLCVLVFVPNTISMPNHPGSTIQTVFRTLLIYPGHYGNVFPKLIDATLDDLARGLEGRQFTSVDLVKVYMDSCMPSGKRPDLRIRFIWRESVRSTRLFTLLPRSVLTP